MVGIDDDGFVAGGADVEPASGRGGPGARPRRRRRPDALHLRHDGEPEGLRPPSTRRSSPRAASPPSASASARATASGRRCRSSTAARSRSSPPASRRPCVSIQQPFFEPTEALDLLEHERCTVAFPAFETIWMPVLNHPRFPTADLSALRTVINAGVPGLAAADAGADPVRAADLLLRLDRDVRVRLHGRHRRHAREAHDDERHPAAGRRDPRRSTPRPARRPGSARPGELLMRGPTRFMRYHDDAERDERAPIDADGWFHTGDLGRKDEDGRRLVRRPAQGHAQGRRRERRRRRGRELPADPPGDRHRPGHRRSRRALHRGARRVRAAGARTDDDASRS